MKIHSKKILAAILSAGVIASSLGATLTSGAAMTSSAADVKISITDNEYANDYLFYNRYRLWGFFPIPSTSKPSRYYTSEDQTFYNNALKAANYCKSLGFDPTTKKFDAYIKSNNQIQRVNSDTLYLSYAKDNSTLYTNAVGQAGSITVGGVDSSFMNPMSSVPDIIAHEYVHLVEHRVAGWDALVKQSSFESGALMEAYSDILAELSETNTDWRMGTSLFKNNSGKKKCLRDFIDPVNTYRPTNYTGARASVKFYDNYKKLKKDYPGDYYSNIDNYSASTIISHAAYLMTTTGLNKATIAQIWFDSLSEYGSNTAPKFTDCKNAVVSATNKFAAKKGYSSQAKAQLLGRVNWSFNQVGL